MRAGIQRSSLNAQPDLFHISWKQKGVPCDLLHDEMDGIESAYRPINTVDRIPLSSFCLQLLGRQLRL